MSKIPGKFSAAGFKFALRCAAKKPTHCILLYLNLRCQPAGIRNLSFLSQVTTTKKKKVAPKRGKTRLKSENVSDRESVRRENKGENSPAAPLNLPTDQFGSRDKMGHFFLSICPFSFCVVLFLYIQQFILKVTDIWVLSIT